MKILKITFLFGSKMKKCNKCQEIKNIEDFHKKKSNNDGLDTYCKVCANSIIRERRKENSNSSTFKYEKTLKGKLVRTYRNMTSRVNGILKSKIHLYLGLDILDKHIFYEWSLNNEEYNTLFNNWVVSGYKIKLSPSIDRKDASMGYTLDNIRWVTFEYNSLNTRTRKNQYST
jgi:hypothetical protein